MDSGGRLVEGFGAMKQSSLIKQLKSVLDQYPKGQILKEMIQNAEDAGATEVKVLYENRQCNTEEDLAKLKYSSHMKALQGPGLCVFNDAQFTDSDWEGIQMIQCSNKEHDRQKVGRYGLGFKSVFHLTDSLCVISGEWIIFINPHQPKDEVCLLKKIISLDYKTTQSILSLFGGRFDFSKSCLQNGYYKGTLFWLPLRQSQSVLSDVVYTETGIMDLFKDFTSEAKVILLFLQSLESISLFKTINFLSKVQNIFTVEIAKQYLNDIRRQRHLFKSMLPKEENLPFCSCQSTTHFAVECKEFNFGHPPKHTSQEWMVVNFCKGGSVSDRLSHLCADPDISYPPYVGVAFPLTNTDHIQGQTFFLLPLPFGPANTTGLPIHVSGFFALTQDRREVKWSADHGKQYQWNQCLISEVIPEAYIILVKALKQHCQARNNSLGIINSLPDYRKVTCMWQHLIEPFYNKYFESAEFFSEVHGGKWIHWRNVILAVYDADVTADVCTTVTKTYIEYKQNIVQLPDHIITQIKKRVQENKVSPEGLCSLLKTSACYMCYTQAERMNLLKYALRSSSHTSLEGLALLPVADGTFQKFSKNQVYFCPGNVHLFPGLENMIVREDLDNFTKQQLSRMAKNGYLGLAYLNANTFPKLVIECFKNNFDVSCSVVLQRSSVRLGEIWIRELWTSAHMFKLNMQQPLLQDLPLVPEINRNTITLHPLTDIFMAESSGGLFTLPRAISQCLQMLGIVILPHVPDYIHAMLPVGNVIQFPSAQGVVNILGHVSKENIEYFNRTADDAIKKEFLQYLAFCKEIHPDAQWTLQHLKLFKNTSSLGRTSSLADVNTIAPIEKIPVAYPSVYLDGLCTSHDIAIRLGAQEVSIYTIISEVLDLMTCTNNSSYSVEQIKIFMKFILKNGHTYLKNREVVKKASRVNFLPSNDDCKLQLAKELFDPRSPSLQKLLYGENRFPHQEFCEPDLLNHLQKLGLKGDRNITLDDVRYSASVCENILHKSNEPSRVSEKGRAILTVLNAFQVPTFTFIELFSYRWMPILRVKPPTYPDNLPFAGKNEFVIGRPKCMYHLSDLPLMGSVGLVTKDILSTEMATFLQKPVEDVVLVQIKNIIDTYTADEHQKYMEQLFEVYKYFSRIKISQRGLRTLEAMKVVWAGEAAGFVTGDKVWINHSSSDVILFPYRHPIPKSLKCFYPFFQQIGSSQSQSLKMLMDVLNEIQQNHKQFPARVNAACDLSLVMKILDVLKRDVSVDKKAILIPVYNRDERLVLVQAEMCVYCESYKFPDDDDEDHDETEDSNFANISLTLARDLGVRILTNPLMYDTEILDNNFCQKEPLTSKLKHILLGYTDGFSVIKEIIQNADDARASEVNFLYDERVNLDARTNLINKGMGSLQGPALWAQNDAYFSKSDLDNISKLNGETKIEDSTKIGRFGLGFNSVYNFTDVPSFISGSTIVIFDPHQSYLGSPGMKVDLTLQKNRTMLSKINDQFKPYQGVFGCHLLLNHSQIGYAGTLFRFPLRTKQQAQQSEISSLSYSQSEMKMFLEMFLSGAGNLLLFCQNVKTVRMYYLPKDIADASKATLLVEVQRNVETDATHLSCTVLKFLSDEWKEKCYNRNTGSRDTVVNENITIAVSVFRGTTELFNIKPSYSRVNWTIAWVLGCKEAAQMAMTKELKGFLPIAAAAVPVYQKDGYVVPLPLSECPKGFYYEGHLFCFLPLPIKIHLPFHIHGAFALTHDRKQLRFKSEDEKSISTEVLWNILLQSDAVTSAVIRLFESLKNRNTVNAESFYKLWPTNGLQFKTIFRTFYEIIVHENPELLLYNGRWISFQKAIVLDPKLRFAKDVGKTAFKAFEHYYSGQMCVIEIPANILQCFTKAGLKVQLQSHILSMQQFYQEFFFPNISDTYWNIKDRDGLVKFALLHGNENIRNLLMNTPCIPTRPLGKLKQPKCLIHPTGKTAHLFLETDGVFPAFLTNTDIFAALTDLGMQNDELQWSVVFERVQSIGKLYQKSINDANVRCRNILYYLEEHVLQQGSTDRVNRFMNCPDAIKEKIQNERFLPILQKPLDWPSEWHISPNKSNLESPRLLCFPECTDIIGSNKLILDSNWLYLISVRRVLQWLGVQSTDDILVSDTVKHLLKISSTWIETLDETMYGKLASICSSLYHHLNEVCKRNAQDLRNLSGKRVILRGKTFLKPEQMAFSLQYVLDPYLYEVDKNSTYRDFFQAVGVKSTFQAEDAADVMMKIAKTCGRNVLSNKLLHCLSQAASLLVHEFDCKVPGLAGRRFESLQLPDKRGVLHPFYELCLDDCEWLHQRDSMKFLNHCISVEVAAAFGVKTKRQEDLRYHCVPFALPFGQCESLTNRLKRILEGYPCDSSIMKELVQNADDAGASELMFIKDFRTHSCDRIFNDVWKPLQGPALCVYSNSYFTSKDLDGIQNLGHGSKVSDPHKIGQYGVGFIKGVIRLVSLQKFQDGPTTQNLDVSKIEETLLRLDILEVDELETFLTYSEKSIPGSTKQIQYFLQKPPVGHYSSYCIYLDQNYYRNTSLVNVDISEAIHTLLNYPLGHDVIYLTRMCSVAIDDIESMLDSNGVVPFTDACTNITTAFPLSGSLIPDEFHFMLDNNFDSLSVGDYVALEIHDPVIDETGNESRGVPTTSDSSNPVFIYAVIKGITSQHVCSMIMKYHVEVGDGRVEEISGARLYTFVRELSSARLTLIPSSVSSSQPDDHGLDLDTVLKEIKQTLRDTWNSLDECDRKRVVKRLYLKWHPDKNHSSREDFCNKVCQHIQLYLSELKECERNDDTELPFKRKKHDYSSFFNYMDSRSRSQRNAYKEWRSRKHDSPFNSGSESGSTPGHRTNAFTNQQEASRWMRQAKIDLDAADKPLSISGYIAFNWISFISHQAAEKALKAMLYKQNARLADQIRNHDLCCVARNLDDATSRELLDDVNELQNLVVDYNRMRYPDRLAFPRIPSDVYTQETSRTVHHLAHRIVCRAEAYVS